jgi:hypothetical protein
MRSAVFLPPLPLVRLALLLLLPLVGAPRALAHLEIQAGRAPYVDGAGAVVGGHTSWGVVLPAAQDGAHAFLRVCEESYDPNPVGGIAASFSFLREDGAVLVGGFLGTHVSRDAGCTMAPVEGALAGFASSSIASVGGRLFVTTFEVQGGASGVYVSDDDGDTWQVGLAPVAGTSFFQVVASPDGTHLMATGTKADAAPAVFISEDGGDQWVDVSSSFSPRQIVRAAAWDLDGTTALFGGVNDENQGQVLRAARPWTEPEPVAAFPSEITQVAVLPGRMLALARLRGELHISVDEGATWEVATDLSAATEAPPGPTDCVVAKADGSGFLGCAKQSFGSLGMFLHSDDGRTWTPLIGFDVVGYRRCPEGTVGHVKCSSYFELLCFDGEDDDFDGLTDCDDDDCADACGVGEGEGEGEGEGGEGEGEGEAPGDSCQCAALDGVGGGGALLSLLALKIARRTRRRLAGAS